MIDRVWGPTHPHRDFHEKAWLRKTMTAGEERWNQLSVAARASFLNTVKIYARKGFSQMGTGTLADSGASPHL